MNAYSFPENVPISDAARDLITKILNNDPTKRPSIDEILNHEFINHGGQVPRILPASTLACPPSSMYVRQFLPASQKGGANTLQGNGGFQVPPATAPIKPNELMSSRGAGDKPIDSNRLSSQQMPAPQTAVGAKPGTPNTGVKDNEVWVKKWVDYSSKYGLGYYLSNEATGVYFNDSTKIVLDPNGYHFDYYERRSADR
jgi:polo-like kinase 1